MSLLSLGYEPYDARLWRLGSSLVIALASADVLHEIVLGLLRLPSQHVPPRLVHKYVHKSASQHAGSRRAGLPPNLAQRHGSSVDPLARVSNDHGLSGSRVRARSAFDGLFSLVTRAWGA